MGRGDGRRPARPPGTSRAGGRGRVHAGRPPDRLGGLGRHGPVLGRGHGHGGSGDPRTRQPARRARRLARRYPVRHGRLGRRGAHSVGAGGHAMKAIARVGPGTAVPWVVWTAGAAVAMWFSMTHALATPAWDEVDFIPVYA